MRGNELIERGTIVVRDGRIAQVGPSGAVNVPADAIRVSAAGKTIIPGLIDAHAHLFYNAYELFPQQKWQMLSNLAYGVTTSYDPRPTASTSSRRLEWSRRVISSARASTRRAM